MSIKKNFISGIKWNSIGKFYRTGFNALVFFILAKILNPDEIGVVGMAMVFVSFFNLILNMGFESAIIQADGIDDRNYTKLWIINIGLGGLLFSSGYFLSGLLSDFYVNNNVGNIFSFLSSIFLISGITVVHKGILVKNLRFKEIAQVEIISISISGILGVTLAFHGFSYWSIVIQQISMALFNSLGYMFKCKWKPILKDLNKEWKEVYAYVRYSLNVLYFNIVNFISQKVDQLLIGKFLGDVELGVYMLAINIVVMPYSQITQVFSKTIFPVLSSFASEKEYFASQYLKYSVLLFVIISPIGIIFSYLNEDIIHFLFGAKWALAVPLIPVLCFQIIRNSIVSPIGVVFLVLNKPDYQWKYSLLIDFPLRIIGIFIGFYFIGKSAFGIILGLNIAATISTLPGMYLGFRVAGIRLINFYYTYKIAIFASLGLLMFGFLSVLIESFIFKLSLLSILGFTYLYVVVIRNELYKNSIFNLLFKGKDI